MKWGACFFVKKVENGFFVKKVENRGCFANKWIFPQRGVH